MTALFAPDPVWRWEPGLDQWHRSASMSLRHGGRFEVALVFRPVCNFVKVDQGFTPQTPQSGSTDRMRPKARLTSTRGTATETGGQTANYADSTTMSTAPWQRDGRYRDSFCVRWNLTAFLVIRCTQSAAGALRLRFDAADRFIARNAGLSRHLSVVSELR